MRSGLGAQLGIAKETVYGTFVAPQRFFPFTSEGLEKTRNYVRSVGLRAGRITQAKNLHVGTTRAVAGPVVQEFLTAGMGKWLDLLHGNTVTPALAGGATLAYEATHNIGLVPNDGKSASVQVGRPDTGNTTRAFSYKGCKVISFRFVLEASGLLTCTFELDGRDEVTSEALGSATYSTTAVPYNFTQGVVKAAGASIGNVRSITIEGTQAQATDRYHLGNSGVKDEPFANGLFAVTANAVLEFKDLTDHDRFSNETVASLALEASGSQIEVGHNNEAKFTLNAAKQVSSGPKVEGPDIITTTASFEGLDDGTTVPLVIYTKSVDNAL